MQSTDARSPSVSAAGARANYMITTCELGSPAVYRRSLLSSHYCHDFAQGAHIFIGENYERSNFRSRYISLRSVLKEGKTTNKPSIGREDDDAPARKPSALQRSPRILRETFLYLSAARQLRLFFVRDMNLCLFLRYFFSFDENVKTNNIPGWIYFTKFVVGSVVHLQTVLLEGPKIIECVNSNKCFNNVNKT